MTNAARRRRAMWQRAIDAKEKGRPLGLCAVSQANMLNLDDAEEISRMHELFNDHGRGYIWAWPWREFTPIKDPDPDETARIIAAVIMRETVT